MAKKDILSVKEIKSQIYSIRGKQVMLDEELSELYGVETKVLNQAVKRNIERFPEEFMFQLSGKEYDILRSQFVTLKYNESIRSQFVISSDNRGKHRKYFPFVFTEQGVAMLSGVLRSETAVKVSIQIMRAFVVMRKFITENGELFSQLDKIEKRQIKFEGEADEKFNKIFNAIEEKEITPKKGIFFDGQIFDACKFVSDIFRSAGKSIVVIDNYIDDSVLTLLSKKKKNVWVKIYTKKISKQLAFDTKKYNEQYSDLEIQELNKSHDRFIIIDDKIVYHIGASLKDLGKKWFAFSKFDKDVLSLLEKLDEK